MTLVIAHRGASAYAPENTMPAFELAIRQSADMLELDLQRSADGVLVVFHDKMTGRWEARPRHVGMCSLAELRAIDLGGARIATLSEVCALAREHGVLLNIELKVLGLGAAVARLLAQERVEEQTLLSSFMPAALYEIAAVNPRLSRAYLMGTRTLHPGVRFRESWPFGALRRVGASAWHPTCLLPLLSRLIPRVRRAGYRVNVWTVNDSKMMRRLIALGVDGIITDKPDMLRRILQEPRSVR